MNLSVIIATHRRAASLDGVLTSIAASSYARENVQVVVADNAGDADTRRLCESYAKQLDLVYLIETTPGKNAALNAAIPYATGQLLVFTDDDIEAPPEWLPETWAAALRWPEHAVFGGKVLPLWPSACPTHVNDERYLGMCFSVLDRAAAEGPSPAFTPFGPNMAIRRGLFDAGLRFNPQIGPRVSSYIMGSETELLRRLKRLGHAPVYVPRSTVRHTIRPEQLTDRWLFGRAFRYGRLLAVRRQEVEGTSGWPALGLVPALIGHVVRLAAATVRGERKDRFDHAMDLAMDCGMIYQAWQAPPVQQDPPLSTAYTPSGNALRS